jgi:arylsulfatase
LLEIGGATYPEKWQNREVLPLAGASLSPVMAGKELPVRPLFFEHEGNRAVRVGPWKLVWTNYRREWELYRIDRDRSELNDLAGEFPDRVAEMGAMWESWATENFVELEAVPQPAKGMPKIYYLEGAPEEK